MVARRLTSITTQFLILLLAVHATREDLLTAKDSNNSIAASHVVTETNSTHSDVQPPVQLLETKEKSQGKLTSQAPTTNLSDGKLSSSTTHEDTFTGCSESGCPVPVIGSYGEINTNPRQSSETTTSTDNGSDLSHISPPPSALGYIDIHPPQQNSNTSTNASENIIPVELSSGRKDVHGSWNRVVSPDPKHHESLPSPTVKAIKLPAFEGSHIITTKNAVESGGDRTESSLLLRTSVSQKEELSSTSSLPHTTWKSASEEIAVPAVTVHEKPPQISKKLAVPDKETSGTIRHIHETTEKPRRIMTQPIVTIASSVAQEDKISSVVDEENYVGPLTTRSTTTGSTTTTTTTARITVPMKSTVPIRLHTRTSEEIKAMTPTQPLPVSVETEAAQPPRLSNPSCASLPLCVKVLVESRFPMCDELGRQAFQAFVAQTLSQYTKPRTHTEQVVLEFHCDETTEIPSDSRVVSSFDFYVTDISGEYEESLTEIAGVLLKKNAKKQSHAGIATPLAHAKVLKVEVIERDEVGHEIHKVGVQTPPAPLSAHSGMIAAIVISAVAGTCLCLLCLLLVIMKQRLAAQASERMSTQRVNGGPTAVELDAYSLDSFSINASFRRRRPRLSANSFHNRGFEADDDNLKELPSRRMSASTLATSLRQRKSKIEDEFKRIPMNMPKPDEIPPGAEVKNRYANVIPNPRTRVVLSDKSDDPAKSYINANFVQGHDGRPGFYIACQAPLKEFVSDFWKMVWEQQSRVILMLTQLEENGVSRCAPYFPESTLDCRQLYGDFQVSLTKKDVREFYTLSTLRLYDISKNLFREVIHLWYTGWPAVGVPSDPTSLVIYLQQARPYLNCNSGPTIVHCSAGSGRTGTLIALDMCMREYEDSHFVDVLRAVSRIRKDKGGAVQNKDQYILIHEAMLEYASILANQSSRPSIRSNE